MACECFFVMSVHAGSAPEDSLCLARLSSMYDSLVVCARRKMRHVTCDIHSCTHVCACRPELGVDYMKK
jgi:hypothetical protein